MISGLFMLFLGFFVSPLRNKILRKFGFRLKKLVSIIATIILFFIAVFTIPTGSDINYEDPEIANIEVVNEEAVKSSINLDNNSSSLAATLAKKEQKKEPEKVEIEKKDVEKIETKVQENNKTAVSEKNDKISNEKKRIPGSENKTTEVVQESNMSVHFIDVDQADATLVICDGEAMLIDTGENSDGTKLQLYLTKQGVKNLKYLVLTHPDSDHIGGADVVITKFPIETVFMSDFVKDTRTYEDVINALEYKRLKWSTPTVGSKYSLGRAEFTIIAPNKKYDDPNEASIGLILEHKENSFLFTGDAEEAENDILNSGIDLDSDVFKAGHHGSKTSNSQALLDKITPKYVVISCGEDNSYGHPHAKPMNTFRSMGVKLFRTDEQGTIVVESDGKNLTWNTSPTDSWKSGEPKESTVQQTKEETKPQVVVEQTSALPPETEQAPDSKQESNRESVLVSVPKPEPVSVFNQRGGFAVNNKNGKIHIVGACNATDPNHDKRMKEPIYFNTYEEAEAYSRQTHPEQDKVKCGNCW